MKLHKTTLLLIALFTFSLITTSQAQKSLLSKADDSFKHFEYIDAQKIYLDVAAKGYSSASLFKKLGDSYYFNSKLKEAYKWYKKLITKYPRSYEPKYLFRYAQSLKSVERYEEADKVMNQFNKKIGKQSLKPSSMSTLDYIEFMKAQSGKFSVDHIRINSKLSDYAPNFYKNQLVFASSRLGSSGAIHEWNDMPFSDLYVSERVGTSKKTKKPKKLKGDVNSRYHEASACFTKDGTTMYFTRNNFLDNKLQNDSKGTIALKLYRATFRNDKWTDIVELPFNSDNYSVAHPTLSQDEKKLFFASDMPGTLGMSDIFVVDIIGNNRYSRPKNLGETINTQGRETFPYISRSGKLYFASDGHVGFGGLDVFVAEYNEFGYVLPFNVGKPVNSPLDDFGFIIDDRTRTGYFSSNREGGKGSDDIYAFTQFENLITSCRQYVQGTVTDEKTGRPIYNTKLVLIDTESGGQYEFYSDVNGKYKMTIGCDREYLVQVFKDGYTTEEFSLESTSKYESVAQKDIQLRKGLGVRRSISIGMDLATILGLEPIYFDLNSAKIRPDAEVELQQIIAALKFNPNYRIDVRSHTDSRAKDSYNLALSKRRAQSTIKYIVEKGGIARSRVSGDGYGETRLINKCKNGVKCSDEEHQMNRRSEFIILKE